MAERRFTKEIKAYIRSEALRSGTVRVEDVAQIIKSLHMYDPTSAEIQWCMTKARKLMASWKDQQGIRVLFAAGPASGEFINIESCSEIAKLNAVDLQLTQKRNGLNAAIEKNDRCKAALTGQAPLYKHTFTNRPFVDLADFL